MKKKFDIFKHLNIKQSSEDPNSTALSLAMESSLVLKPTRYLLKRPFVEFNFLKYSNLLKVKLFFITVTKRLEHNKWAGFDSSVRCILISEYNFVLHNRYEIYGRLTKEKYLTVDVIRVNEINYKELVYQII